MMLGREFVQLEMTALIADAKAIKVPGEDEDRSGASLVRSATPPLKRQFERRAVQSQGNLRLAFRP